MDSPTKMHPAMPVCDMNCLDQGCVGAAGYDRDAQLIWRVQRGDLGAFEELVDQYKQRLVNYAARMIGDAVEAQDIAQKVFVQVFRSSGKFRFTARFSTWLFTIARNLCLNELRRRRRHRAEPWIEHPEANEPQPARALERVHEPDAVEDLLRAELVSKLDEALADLPERQRTAILLLRDGDNSYEAIAAILGTTIPATKSLIHHGRRRLKGKLMPYLDTGARRSDLNKASGSPAVLDRQHRLEKRGRIAAAAREPVCHRRRRRDILLARGY